MTNDSKSNIVNNRKMKISVAGTGYVGLVAGVFCRSWTPSYLC